MKTIIGIVIGALVLVGAVVLLSGGDGTGTGSETTTAEAVTLQDLGEAPEFTGESFSGETVSLQEFEGEKIVVANSWAVWCPFCKDELPDFAELQQEFNEEVRVISIDRQESKEKQQNFTDSIGVTDDITFLLDPDDEFYRKIGGFSMPETLFIDKAGTVRLHKRGPLTFPEMKAIVEKMLAQEASAADGPAEDTQKATTTATSTQEDV